MFGVEGVLDEICCTASAKIEESQADVSGQDPGARVSRHGVTL